jgi:glucodextranase-like protein
MTNRGAGRLSQVRPRPPSTGRPAAIKVRPRAPSHTRLAPRRQVERSSGIPLGSRLLLVLAVLALGGAVLYTASGGLGSVASALASTVGGFVGNLTATPVPTPTPLVIGATPSIESPGEPYTNVAAVDLVVLVPADAVGKTTNKVRLYVALAGKAPKRLVEAPVGTTPRVLIPSVKLVAGTNDFTATILGPAGETPPSSVVTYVLDQAVPKVTVTSPKDGATVNKAAVTITGKTQGRSMIFAHNSTSSASATALASADGAFSVVLALDTGANAVTVQATDPAGNIAAVPLTIRRGTGKLSASLHASTFRFSRAKLPYPLILSVVVTDPDGTPLAGARATFSVTIPGVPPITADRTTGADGWAEFKTTIPKGASVGTGPASVLVSAGALGTTSDRTVLTVTK